MQRVLIWCSVHKRQWRLVHWLGFVARRRSGIRLNESRGMQMRHYLTKVGAVCDGEEGAEVASKALQQDLRCRCGTVRLDRHFAAPFALAQLLWRDFGSMVSRFMTQRASAVWPRW